MTETEKKVCQAFLGVVEVFFRKNKDPNYKEIVKTLITTQRRNVACHSNFIFYTRILISFKKILGTLAKKRYFKSYSANIKAVSGPVGQRNDGRLKVVFDKGRYM